MIITITICRSARAAKASADELFAKRVSSREIHWMNMTVSTNCGFPACPLYKCPTTLGSILGPLSLETLTCHSWNAGLNDVENFLDLWGPGWEHCRPGDILWAAISGTDLEART